MSPQPRRHGASHYGHNGAGIDGLKTKQDLANFILHTVNIPPNLRGQITRNLLGMADLTARLTTAEADIVALQGADTALDGRLDTLEALNIGSRLTTAEGDINDLQAINADSRLDALERDAHRVHVYRTTNHTVTSGVNTDIPFGSERYDEPSNDQHVQTGATNVRLTCTKTGKYLVYGAVEWEHSNAGSTQADVGYRRACWIRRTDSGGGTQDLAKIEQPPLRSTDSELSMAPFTEIELTLGDYVRLFVFHDHPTASLDIVNTTYSPEFGMVRIGPN